MQKIYEKEKGGLVALVGNDPVSFLYRFADPGDIELAGFIASQFAYGRVQQVMNFLTGLFRRMGGSPYDFIAAGDFAGLSGAYYRFHKGPDIIRLFTLLKKIVERYGGIGKMIEHYYEGDLRKAVWAARADLLGPSDDLLFFSPRQRLQAPSRDGASMRAGWSAAMRSTSASGRLWTSATWLSPSTQISSRSEGVSAGPTRRRRTGKPRARSRKS